MVESSRPIKKKKQSTVDNLDSTIQYSTVHYNSTVHTIQYSTVHYNSTVQYSTVQYSIVHNIVQCSTV